MSIQRSKSAPQSVAGLSTFNLPRSFSHEHLQKNAGQASTSAATPAVSPSISRVDREDPFSLTGFFPPLRFRTEHQEEWNWLRADREGDIQQDDAQSTYSFSSAGGEGIVDSPLTGSPAAVMFGQVEDDIARETIRCEDKLGVLSLSMFITYST